MKSAILGARSVSLLEVGRGRHRLAAAFEVPVACGLQGGGSSCGGVHTMRLAAGGLHFFSGESTAFFLLTIS